MKIFNRYWYLWILPVMLIAAESHAQTTPCAGCLPWVLSYEAWSPCSQVRFTLYSDATKSNPLVTRTVSPTTTWPPPNGSSEIVWLPAGTNLSNAYGELQRIVQTENCCFRSSSGSCENERDITRSLSANCAEFSTIESWGEAFITLERLVTPAVAKTGECSITFDMAAACSSVSWNITQAGVSVNLTGMYGQTITLTRDDLAAILPTSVNWNAPFSINATTYTSLYSRSYPYTTSTSFTISTPSPQIDFSSTDVVCDVPGKIEIDNYQVYGTVSSLYFTIQGVDGSTDDVTVPVSNLSAFQYDAPEEGTYHIQVSNVISGSPDDVCASEDDIIVGDRTNQVNFNFQATPRSESCHGLPDDGSINVTVNNGVGPYSYEITPGTNGSFLQSVSSIDNLSSGTYSLLVSDSRGCDYSVTDLVITEPDEVVLTDAFVTNAVSCHPESITGNRSDGRIEIEAIGPGSLVYIIDGEKTSPVTQTGNAIFSNLPPDNYSVMVRSGNCFPTVPLMVLMEEPPRISYLGINKTDITCTGQTLSEGRVSVVNTSGGAGDYEYSLDGVNYQQSEEFRFLPAGTYSVRIKDRNGCEVQTDQLEIISEALQVTLASQQNLTCSDHTNGTATINIEGGLAPYSINWSNGQSSLTATDLSRGDHSVTVIDENGCEGSSTVTIDSPETLSVEAAMTPPTCAEDSDGTIMLLASGGNGDYTYSWGNNITGAARNNLPTGTYHITVIDREGCEAEYDVTLLPPPQAELGEDRSICPNQPVVLAANVEGIYRWTSDSGFSSDASEVSVSEPGVYRLVLTDVNGCVSEDEVLITQTLDLLNADFLLVSEAHAGDTLLAIDISWPMPDNVQWSLPSTANGISTDDDIAEIAFSEMGTYDVTMIASLGGCSDEFTKQITILAPRENAGGKTAGREALIQEVKMSPNPTTGTFNLTVALRDDNHVKVRLLTSDGNRTLLTLHDDSDRMYKWNLDLSHLVQGLYFVMIESGTETKVLRLIKY